MSAYVKCRGNPSNSCWDSLNVLFKSEWSQVNSTESGINGKGVFECNSKQRNICTLPSLIIQHRAIVTTLITTNIFSPSLPETEKSSFLQFVMSLQEKACWLRVLRGIIHREEQKPEEWRRLFGWIDYRIFRFNNVCCHLLSRWMNRTCVIIQNQHDHGFTHVAASQYNLCLQGN